MIKYSFSEIYEYLNIRYNLKKENVVDDSMSLDFKTNKFQCLSSECFYKKNITESEIQKSLEQCLYQLKNIYLNINNNQKIALIVSDAFLTNPDIDWIKLKRDLTNCCLDSVIQTSFYGDYYKNESIDYVYYPNSLAALILKRNSKKVNFINFLGWMSDEPEFSEFNIREISLSKIKLNDDYKLLPSYRETVELINKTKTKLNDIADIRQGCNISRVVEYWSPIDCDVSDWERIFTPVEIKHINESVITGMKMNVVGKKSAKLNKHYLYNGDVLLTIKAANLKAAIVDCADEGNFIASNNLLVIHPKDGVAPEFILGYLQSKIFAFYISTSLISEYVKYISISQLKDAPIPLKKEEVFNSKKDIKFRTMIQARNSIANNVKGLKSSKNIFSNEIEKIM